MAQREQIHISSWPAIWPTRIPALPGNNDAKEPRNYDNFLANQLRAAAHCFEAKAFGVAEFLQQEEDIIYADLDLESCVERKQYHDVVGGYQRLDVFRLEVNRYRKAPVIFRENYDTKEWNQ
ncbi:uncharacterized protein N7529_010160 [Penicillium soppii]|uniref:uncharacterized protein n=1 Tax=Penicillium soppii TaxID=69789 RepID=UPI002547139A|nr:uncharacterized protein N7529_010160 [Penicillium soppii]KAJ5856216.1 hypothetical protein N7529_010160 [Penicillium soppii]